MIAAHRRRIEKTDREKIFIIGHADEFPKGSPVDLFSAEIDARIEDFLARDAALFSTHGGKLQVQEVKGDTRDFLIGHLSDIATAAHAIGEEARFVLPNPRSAQNLINAADEWYAETVAHEETFVARGGLEADFRTKLLNSKEEFQNAIDAVFHSSHGNIEAFEALEELMLDIMNLTRRRAALLHLKYKNNPSKLASWLIASHLEAPPKRKIGIVLQTI